MSYFGMAGTEEKKKTPTWLVILTLGAAAFGAALVMTDGKILDVVFGQPAWQKQKKRGRRK